MSRRYPHPLGASSQRYGLCEVCGQFVSDVHIAPAGNDYRLGHRACVKKATLRTASEALAAAGFTHRRPTPGHEYSRHEILDAHGNIVARLTAYEMFPWLRRKNRCATVCISIVRAALAARRAAA